MGQRKWAATVPPVKGGGGWTRGRVGERFGEGSEEYLVRRCACILLEEAVGSVGMVTVSFSSRTENQKCINPEGKQHLFKENWTK